jgi:nucleoside-diphosphate-sugar epimerase
MQQNTVILVTGACGQIGTVLCKALQEKYGFEQVIVSDIRSTSTFPAVYEQLDVTDSNKLFYLISKYQVTQIYHLAAILSAKGEANPVFTWNINMNGLLNILEAARNYQLEKVFYPSTIAVFGMLTPRQQTPQHPNLTPETVYGISKAAGENWCNYYHKKHGVDVRSVRYPGIISWDTLPGGGTTDYAVEIFHEAVRTGHYTSYIAENTYLPMMYMPDAIRATMELMEAPMDKIKVRTSYNISAMSICPADLANEIQYHLPEFNIDYMPDFRQEIAASWPESIDDSASRQDWGWKETFNLSVMCSDIIKNLQAQK